MPVLAVEEITVIKTMRPYTPKCTERCRQKGAHDDPEGNMGYNQYTVPDTVAVKTSFVAFL